MGALIFREQWNETPPARPVTQDHLSHPNLIVSLHGPGRLGLKKSHHSEIAGDPPYIWSGKCAGPWALSLQHGALLINLEEAGMVRWCSRQSGGHRLRLIVKPCGASWLVSDQFAGVSAGWREFEIPAASLTWQLLDIAAIRPMGAAPAMPLTEIDAIGFSDLEAGGGSEACSRLAWFEVWGGKVARRHPG
jgi:hypothetical protein